MGGVDVFEAQLKDESIFIRIRFLKGKVRVNGGVLQRKQSEENWCPKLQNAKTQNMFWVTYLLNTSHRIDLCLLQYSIPVQASHEINKKKNTVNGSDQSLCIQIPRACHKVSPACYCWQFCFVAFSMHTNGGRLELRK